MEVVLGAPLLEGVEEVHLLAVLMEEVEEEVLGPGVVAAQDHHPLSDSVWLSLALTSVDFEDAVYTKAAVAPGWKNDKDICQTKHMIIHFIHIYFNLNPESSERTLKRLGNKMHFKLLISHFSENIKIIVNPISLCA